MPCHSVPSLQIPILDKQLDDILDVVRVYSDNKISLVKDVRKALGDIKPRDKLVIVKMNGGCFIKKRQITVGNEQPKWS